MSSLLVCWGGKQFSRDICLRFLSSVPLLISSLTLKRSGDERCKYSTIINLSGQLHLWQPQPGGPLQRLQAAQRGFLQTTPSCAILGLLQIRGTWREHRGKCLQEKRTYHCPRRQVALPKFWWSCWCFFWAATTRLSAWQTSTTNLISGVDLQTSELIQSCRFLPRTAVINPLLGTTGMRVKRRSRRTGQT